MSKLIRKIKKKSRTLSRIITAASRKVKDEGLSGAIKYLKDVSGKINGFHDPAPSQDIQDCIQYVIENFANKEEIERQSKVVFEHNVKFSVIVPLYNTPSDFLKEMINSVIGQSYQNWELCLADGSDGKHDEVEKICLSYNDPRISYKRLEKNEGIAGNTNACLKMATGDYIFLFDHDDILHAYALHRCAQKINEVKADFIYSDEMVFEDDIENVKLIHFKPDFSADSLRGHNYICHLCCFSKRLLDEVGYFSFEHDGSQDYDMILRLTEKAQSIVHIPEVLYYWRSHPGSVASDVSVKPYCRDSAIKALDDHLKRIGLKGKAIEASYPTTYKIEYEIIGEPLISIIIPNKDYIKVLDKCLKSIYKKSTYKNFEILVIENNSENKETFEYYENIKKEYNNLKVIIWDGPWNYSAINNFGVQYASGDYYVLLNNDVEVITPRWLEEMLMFTQRNDVGATGALLYYPDDTVQHAGLIMGIGGLAAHSHRSAIRDSGGYMHRLCVVQNMSGVTGACLMTKKSIWEKLGGLDESFVVSFNDVDFCLRIREAGYQIIYTPFCELYHYESKSRGYDDTPEKKNRMDQEGAKLKARWKEKLERGGDPFYNVNLTLDREDFTLK